ncbi:hypothetical protein [Marinibactrum halimedae]|nr:hypothetical protein [Marinibactrum halimedae]MCD9460625.1 hypothetical protein [Marinibactrum halimedae]
MTQLHAVRLKAPYFSHENTHTDAYANSALLRYLDADFINRFRQQIQQGQLNSTDTQAWLAEEQHSVHDQKPVLRLPSHRAFHVVCCEAVCHRFGEPALDPARITSAGFVIRRKDGGQEKAWIIEDGESLGWLPAPTSFRDPDLDRRLCPNGVVHARADKPAYSGEATHPLHPLDAYDEQGKRHTLLFGYLPLGGFYYERNSLAAIDGPSLSQTQDYVARALPWPFGYRNGKGQPWLSQHDKPIVKGVPSQGMFELLRLLVTRYHLGERRLEESHLGQTPPQKPNAGLEAIATRLNFIEHRFFEQRVLGATSFGFQTTFGFQTPLGFQSPFGVQPNPFLHSSFQLLTPAERLHAQQRQYRAQLFQRHKVFQTYSLLAYLQGCFRAKENPLVPWIVTQEARLATNPNAVLTPLPSVESMNMTAFTLSMTASDADELRHELNQRYRTQTLANAKEIPLPKFGQRAEDVFEVVPFVRALNDGGKEQIYWAEREARSLAFRVAAPFDPEASRPSLIQMPSLRDLKRGLAKGASFLTPGDTFDMVNSLNTKDGIGPDLVKDTQNAGLGLQWICSFSLPVVTLVAMILLMIMVMILNIVFFWLPWVRVCLPFPKIGK